MVGHPQFGVADLPQQEVADPHLAGGADQQIGIGHAGRVEVVRDARFVDVFRRKLAPPNLFGDPADGVGHLRPAAVVDRQAEPGARVRRAHRDRLVHLAEHGVGDAVAAADDRDHDNCSSMIVARSSIMYCSSRCIRKSSSCCGRFQFSLDRQYSVSCSMSSRAHSSTVRRTLATPRRCPSIRGSPCRSAQRPLPSMMIAMCRGRRIDGQIGILPRRWSKMDWTRFGGVPRSLRVRSKRFQDVLAGRCAAFSFGRRTSSGPVSGLPRRCRRAPHQVARSDPGSFGRRSGRSSCDQSG